MQATSFRMTTDARVRVTFKGCSITGWIGRVEQSLGDGSAGWVRFEQELPISLRASVRDKSLMFLTADQVTEA